MLQQTKTNDLRLGDLPDLSKMFLDQVRSSPRGVSTLRALVSAMGEIDVACAEPKGENAEEIASTIQASLAEAIRGAATVHDDRLSQITPHTIGKLQRPFTIVNTLSSVISKDTLSKYPDFEQIWAGTASSLYERVCPFSGTQRVIHFSVHGSMRNAFSELDESIRMLKDRPRNWQSNLTAQDFSRQSLAEEYQISFVRFSNGIYRDQASRFQSVEGKLIPLADHKVLTLAALAFRQAYGFSRVNLHLGSVVDNGDLFGGYPTLGDKALLESREDGLLSRVDDNGMVQDSRYGPGFVLAHSIARLHKS